MTAADPRIARLAAELDITVRRLQWMQAELDGVARTTRAPVVPSAPARFPAPPTAFPAPPVRSAAPRPAPPRTAAPVFTVARILAGTGVLVTLVGVSFLLVLAAQAGLLGPAVRVGLGTALAGSLVAGALWLHRRPGGTVGAQALAATGFAAAYLDIVAVTGIYHWVHPAAGLTLAGVVALGGLALAARWRTQWLGVALFAPTYLLAPPLADDGHLLGAFTLVLAVASIGVRRPADWPWLHVVRSAGTAVTFAALAVAAGTGDALPVLGGAVVAAVVGLLAAADPAARAGRMQRLVWSGVASAPPVLLAAARAPEWAAAVAVAGLVAGAVALGLADGTRMSVRALWFATAAGSALSGVLLLVPAAWAPAAVLALGAAALLAAHRDPAGAWTGAALGGVGVLLAAQRFGGTVLEISRAARHGAGTAPALVAAALALVLAVALLWRLIPVVRADRRAAAAVAGGVVLLSAMTALLANAGWALAGAEGMRWGHGIATVTWMAAGAAALLRRRSGDPAVLTVAGLTMIGAAVAKLFLFDLAALDGAVRVIAFLLVGVALLGVGAAYAARSDRPRTAA